MNWLTSDKFWAAYLAVHILILILITVELSKCLSS